MNIGPYIVNEIKLPEIKHKLNKNVDASNVQVIKTKIEPATGRYWFKATSDGIKEYIVTIKLLWSKIIPNKRLKDIDVAVACSCPAFLYQGSDYHAQRLGYLDKHSGYPLARSAGIAPIKNDPENNKLICKHILATYNKFKDMKIS